MRLVKEDLDSRGLRSSSSGAALAHRGPGLAGDRTQADVVRGHAGPVEAPRSLAIAVLVVALDADGRCSRGGRGIRHIPGGGEVLSGQAGDNSTALADGGPDLARNRAQADIVRSHASPVVAPRGRTIAVCEVALERGGWRGRGCGSVLSDGNVVGRQDGCSGSGGKESNESLGEEHGSGFMVL